MISLARAVLAIAARAFADIPDGAPDRALTAPDPVPFLRLVIG
jgi:hypothetical protein